MCAHDGGAARGGYQWHGRGGGVLPLPEEGEPNGKARDERKVG